MKKIVLLFVVLSFITNAFCQKQCENSYCTLQIPKGWQVQNDPSNGSELMYFYNSENEAEVYNMGLILGFERLQDPTTALQNQMTLKATPLLKEASFGNVYNSVFMGKVSKAVDFETKIFGGVFKGTIYAFNEGGCSILTFGCYRLGTKSELPKIWRTVKWKNHIRVQNKFANFRNELGAFCKEINKNLEGSPVVSNGTQFLSIQLEEEINVLIYTYKLLEQQESSYTDEQKGLFIQNLHKVLLEQIKKSALTTEIIAKCMKEKYIFQYTYLDKNSEFFINVQITPDDYQ